MKPFKIKASSESRLTYTSSNNKTVSVNKSTGKATVKGTGIAVITIKAGKNSVKVTVKVSPKKQAVKSIKAVRGKKLTVKWKKDTMATRYQVQVSTDKKFKKIVKTVEIKKNKMISANFSKLKAGSKYYVRVRSYKKVKVNGKTQTLCGTWSNGKKSGAVKK